MLLYWLWLTLLDKLSKKQKLVLVQHFSDMETLYNCTDFSDLGLTAEQIDQLQNKDLTGAKNLKKQCEKKDIGILTLLDKKYPARLRNISDPPLVLYYKGVLPDFDKKPAIAVVGTRKATSYGIAAARQFGGELSSQGGIVVSGGASGVDTMALQGALNAGGQTVAVLGCGVDVVYPRNNRRLFMQIQEQGCLVSEYLPGTGPKSWQFPERNRIISGLSNGVLVIEAPEKSGALITARDALEQGRDVYAVPANIDMPTCVGSNALLDEGAVAAVSGWHIMRQYAAQYPDAVSQNPQPEKKECKLAQPVQKPEPDKKDIDNPANNSYSVKNDGPGAPSSREQMILDKLDHTPRAMDEVVSQLDIPSGEVMKLLTKLTLQGKVITHPGGMISKSRIN